MSQHARNSPDLYSYRTPGLSFVVPDDPRLELPDSDELDCRDCDGDGCPSCEGIGTRSRAALRAEADEARAEIRADQLRDEDKQ